MGMPIASSPREASSTSGQRLLDEARLMPIHVIAALACLLPVRRATSVSPIVALRHD